MKLIKNYLYNAGYQIIILIIPFLTIPYISRVLGPEGVGTNAYTNSIIQYFILFGNIGINLYGNRAIAYSRDNKKKLNNNFWEITILRFITIGVSYLLFLVYLFFVNNYHLFYLYQSILIVAGAFDISWFFIGIEDFKKTVFRNIIIKLMSLLAVFLFVKTEKDVGIYILILSLSTLFGNLSLWPYLIKVVEKPKLSDLNIFKHFSQTLQLFIPQIATQIYLVLNKTILGLVLGLESAGLYENSDKIIRVVLSIVTAVGIVMLPRVANTFSKGNSEKVIEYLYQSFNFVSFISIPMTFGMIAIAPTFSIWFLGENFIQAGDLIKGLSLIIILVGWSNVLGTQYLLPTNQTKYYTISVVYGALINIIASITLIPLMGIKGAIVAVVMAEATVTIIQFYYAKKQINILTLFGDTWKYLIAATIMFLIINPMTEYIAEKTLLLGTQFITGVSVYLLICILWRASIIKEFLRIIKVNRNAL